MAWVLRAWLLGVVFLLLAPLAPAQGTSLGQVSGPKIPEGLKSPRATLSTFFEGMRDARLSDAVTALDLSQIGAFERPSRGPQLAYQLWAVLNRERYIEVSELSDSPSAPPYLLPITNLIGQPIGAVTIAKSQDGAFRFTSETLDTLEEKWRQVKAKPVVGRLPDPSPNLFQPSAWLDASMAPEAREKVLGFAYWKWIFVIMLVIVMVVAIEVIHIGAGVVGRRILKLEPSSKAYRQISRAATAASLIIASVLIYRNFPYLGLPSGITGIVDVTAHVFAVFGGGLLAFLGWEAAVALYVRRFAGDGDRAEQLVAPIVSQLGKTLIVFVAIIALLSMVGVNVIGLVATLGLGGIVLAFAAKNSVENLLGSIMFLIERPFRIGDSIRVGGVEGKVEHIRLRSTRIRTPEDSIVILPNSTLVSQSVENFGMRRFRRFRTTVAISLTTPPEKLSLFLASIRAYLDENPNVRDEQQFVHVNDLENAALIVLVDCLLIAPTRETELQTREAVLQHLLASAAALGVELSPTA